MLHQGFNEALNKKALSKPWHGKAFYLQPSAREPSYDVKYQGRVCLKLLSRNSKRSRGKGTRPRPRSLRIVS
jgi:hypothetical protein